MKYEDVVAVRRVCSYPGRIVTVKYEDVVVDLRRSAELIYRFVGVDSVPEDTRAWIDRNYAAVSRKINQSKLYLAKLNASRVRSRAPGRYPLPPSAERSQQRVLSRYLSPSEERRRRLAPGDDSTLKFRHLSPSEKLRRTRLESADDNAAVKSRYVSHSEKLRSRRRRAAVSVEDDAPQSAYLSPAQNWRSRRLAVVDDNASRSRYPTETRPVDDYTAPADSRRRRARLSPVEDDAPTSDNMSPSRKLRRMNYVPLLKAAEYLSPLEKWKKRLSPSESAVIMNEEICKEYFRLSGTNPN